ncbi:MAG TPA: GntR family transcriptional regulator [Alphaproteobacteria bacterium]|nr:GntR family transcriptional regulator [Alphaproteobacteria bacterium]
MSIPAYLQILQELRTRIVGSVYRIGDRIPTDEALMEEFGVSRFTARAAVDVLVADGIVKRYRGRGTFVIARPNGAGSWMLASLDDIVLSSFPSAPVIVDCANAVCDRRVAAALALDDDAEAFRIRLMRRADSGPYAYSIIHVPLPFAARLPRGWRKKLSSATALVGMVAEANGLSLYKAIQVAYAKPAAAAEARALELSPGAPLLVLERTFMSRDGLAIEHSQIFCRSDRYKQMIEFRRPSARAGG